MNGEKLKAWRTRKGMSQDGLAELINGPLDRKYGSATVSGWESGKRTMPAHVENYLTILMLDDALPAEETSEPRPEDSAPGDDHLTFTPQTPISTSSVYARTCEELFEMLSMGVGLVGAGIGNNSLKLDAQIIHDDKEALGKAYGKLAETNETFRRMLTGMTSGGAWMEVAFVTGTTLGKIYASHQQQAQLEPHGLRPVSVEDLAPGSVEPHYAA